MTIANGTCISWVRPWDKNGKCHMNEKEDSMLVKRIAGCTHRSSTVFQ